MKLLTRAWAILAALLVGGLLAVPRPALASKAADPKQAGVLHVSDAGKLFSEGGIDKAKSTMGNAKFDHGLTVTIETFGAIPDDRKANYTKDNEAKFFKEWAVSLAKEDRAKGIYVLVCRSPGYVEVIADKTTRERGFTNEKEQKLRDLLRASFKDAKAAKDAGKSEAEQYQIRDTALLASVNYVVDELKDTSVPTTATHNETAAKKAAKQGGMSIAGWICIGLCVLLGIWLVIGLIRAFTGGGGGGYGGGGYGGGGGGGGFFTGLLGGMFGAMAGMWLYNHMFGGSSFGSDAYASDGSSAYGGDSSGADTSGDGDFSGDAGAGGSYDDGGSGGGYDGGGDYGGGDGGGGDYGGGGDFGGGGGDFGGGDF